MSPRTAELLTRISTHIGEAQTSLQEALREATDLRRSSQVPLADACALAQLVSDLEGIYDRVEIAVEGRSKHVPSKIRELFDEAEKICGVDEASIYARLAETEVEAM